MDIEKIKNAKTVVVHDNCADGLASALLIQEALPNAEILFIQHGTEAHRTLEPTPNMLFCDFAPHPERVDEFAKVGTIVLDHHRTAKWIVERCGGIFADENEEPGVSGAVLAYRHVYKPLVVDLGTDAGGNHVHEFAERLATLTGIRDTWQNESPLWHDAVAQQSVLTAFPKEWWMSLGLRQIASLWLAGLNKLGPIMVEKWMDRVRKITQEGFRFTSKRGTRGIIFQGTQATSDAAEMLGSEVDVILGFKMYLEEGKPTLVLSLRSHTDFDCARMAKMFGGGGHTRAAGFSIAIRPDDLNVYAMAPTLVDHYESTL